jgi:23S rRNA pseudouridine1911/1915/1917 synthase
VVYEDEQLLVVDKPAGLVVHPGRGHSSGTLVNGLLARPGFESVPADPGDPEGFLRPGIVHRIDKDTSGLLVVAKTAEAREELKLQFQAHSIERAYVALTMGTPRPGRLDTLHGRDAKNRLRFSCNVREGKRAITNVAVKESLFQGRAAFVECRLETGRTHQIRVHLSEILKTPILADELYGGFQGPPEVVAIAKALGRHALHARLLGFMHPSAKKLMRFESPLPSDMSEALEGLRVLPR